jgi:phosphoglycerate kinase
LDSLTQLFSIPCLVFLFLLIPPSIVWCQQLVQHLRAEDVFRIGDLEHLLGAPVRFATDCVGDEAKAMIADIDIGGVVLLENVRFHAGEEANDPAFAAQLAELGDVYVNDAFSAAHRAHASTEGLARLLPAYAGESMRRELDALDAALGNPQKPVIGIVGGAKVSTKLDLLKNLVRKLDRLAIGGGMANTFLFAQGIDIGGSLAERDMAGAAESLLGDNALPCVTGRVCPNRQQRRMPW